MSKVFKARVAQTTTTAGTGDIALSVTAPLARRTIQAAVPPGARVSYLIAAVDGSGNETGQWETGIGTYMGSNTLQRTEPQEGSDTLPVNFAAGTKKVVLTPTAADFVAATSPMGLSVPMLQGTAQVPQAQFDAGEGQVLAPLAFTLTDDPVVAAIRFTAGAGDQLRVAPIDGASDDNYDLTIQSSAAIGKYVWMAETGQSAYTVASTTTVPRGQMLRLECSTADDARMVVGQLFSPTESGRKRTVNFMGKAGTFAPDPAGAVTPPDARLPTTPTFWLPMHDLSGTSLASGFSTTTDFVRPLAVPLSNVASDAWTAKFGMFKLPDAAPTCFGQVDLTAASADGAWLKTIFGLDNLDGQQLLIGFSISVDVTSDCTLLSFGRGETGGSVWTLRIANTSELLQMQVWPQGGAAYTTTTITGVDLSSFPNSNERVWCVLDIRGLTGGDSGKCSVVGHTSFNAGAITTSSAVTVDLKGAGTAAPSGVYVASSVNRVDLNLFRRGGATPAQYLGGGTNGAPRVSEFFAQRRTTPSTTAALAALGDMLNYRGEFPRVLRG